MKKTKSELPIVTPSEHKELVEQGVNKYGVKKYGEETFAIYPDGTADIRPVYSFQALDWLVDEINKAIENECDRVIMITGDERVGKTTLGLELALKLNPNLAVDDICFTGEELLNRMNTIEPGGTIVLDEGGYAKFAHEFWSRIQRSLVKAFQVIGKKHLKFIIILPHRKLLNKQIRERRVTYWFHVVMWGSRRGYTRLREARTNEWNVEAWWDGLFTLVFPKCHHPIWEPYEEKKDEFIQNMLKVALLPQPDGFDGKYKPRVHLAIHTLFKDHKWTERRIAELLGYSQPQISTILSRIERDPSLIQTEKR